MLYAVNNQFKIKMKPVSISATKSCSSGKFPKRIHHECPLHCSLAVCSSTFLLRRWEGEAVSHFLIFVCAAPLGSKFISADVRTEPPLNQQFARPSSTCAELLPVCLRRDPSSAVAPVKCSPEVPRREVTNEQHQ